MDREPNAPPGLETNLTGPGAGEVARSAVGAILADGASPENATLVVAESSMAGAEPSQGARRPAPAVPGYEILGELGRGAMGVVYLARQALLNRACALKMILAGDYATPEAVVRFLAEAEAVARLQHPNVVQIHHIGEAGGLPFFELEFCAGGSLEKTLDGTPWPSRAAAALVERVARGVAEAHRLGLVHRDLKPANVLLGDDGTPKVADFGLVKIIGSDPGFTQSNSILGSPSYMAPEQARGRVREVGPRADIYSLGAILYELLTGRPPFRGATVLETLQQVKWAEPVAPSRLVPGLPRDVETIALKCLEKEPMRRYSSAGVLAEDLRRFLDGEPILARPSLPWERAAKWARRRPALAAMLAAVHALLAALLITGAWSYVEIRRALGVADASRNAALAEMARALLSETRGLRLSREPGWRTEAIANLRRLASTKIGRPDTGRLRDEAVACVAALDARERPRMTPAGPSILHGLRYSPDGKFLATNDLASHRICLWDAERLALTRAIQAADHGPVMWPAFGFHPGGSRLAYADPGRGVSYLALDERTASSPPPRIEPEGPGLPYELAFDGDGRRVAVAWASAPQSPALARVVVYDVGTARPIRSIGGPFDWCLYQAALALSPDGRHVAFMGPDHEVRVCEVDGDRPPSTLGRHRDQVFALAFDADGRRLASGSDDTTIKVWDRAAPNRESLTLLGNKTTVTGVAFSPDGGLLASSGSDRSIRLWDAWTGEARMTLNPKAGTLSAIAFSPDGGRLAACGNEAVVAYDLAGHRERRELVGQPGGVEGLAFHPRRPELITAGGFRILAWDVASGRHRVAATDGLYPGLPAISPDGSLLAFRLVDFSGTRLPGGHAIRLAELRDPDAATRLRTGYEARIDALAFDPEGRRLATGDRGGGVIVWDVAAGRAVVRAKRPKPILAVAFIAGGRLLIAEEDGDLVVRDPGGGTPTRRAGVVGGLTAVAIAASGDRAVIGRGDGTLRAFRLPDLEPIGPPEPAHRGPVTALAISPDGLLLASAGKDLGVALRDARTLQPLASLPGQSIAVTLMAFGGDSRFLALASDKVSKTTTLWDLTAVRSGLAELGLDWGSPAPPASAAGEAGPTPGIPASRPGPSGTIVGGGGPGLSAPADDTALARRIDALKAEGRHVEAADALDRWIARHPDNHGAWVDAASLRARGGDRDGYDRHRRRMLEQFGETTYARIAERTAKACLLLPGDGEAIAGAARLAGLAVAKADEDPDLTTFFLLADGLAQYRLGRFEAADGRSRQALKGGGNPTWNLEIPANYVRAMALFRLGRADEARAALARGAEIQASMPKPGLDPDDDGHDQRICETLRREAEAVVLDDPSFPADPFAK